MRREIGRRKSKVEKVTIVSLEDRSDCAPLVAKWISNEWRRLPIHNYLEAVGQGKQWGPSLPRTLVALDQMSSEVVGTASLLNDDMEIRPDLNPWFGCLFVTPSRRKKGIGGQLIAASEELARTLSLKRLYLFAAHGTKLYERFGWSYIGREFYEGEWTTVMVKELS